MTKRLLILSLLISVIINSSFAAVSGEATGDFILRLGTSVKNGSGTLDSIDGIPGYDINGITVYLGYQVGGYSQAVQLKDLKAMAGDSDQADTEISLVPADSEETADTSVTIYLAADSNVKSNVSVRLAFMTGSGWVRENDEYSIEIVSAPGTKNEVSFPEDTNVTAALPGGGQILLDAHPGKPKGEATPIIAYSVLTWPNEGIPAGNYNADVSVVIVNEG